MPKENIVNKISGLFRLSKNNPSKAEASKALSMAKKLMIKYNISMVDIGISEEDKQSFDKKENIHTFYQKENGSPLFKTIDYVGKINSRAIFGLKKHQWLCIGINGTSDDGGNTYTVTYTFQKPVDSSGFGYSPDTWGVMYKQADFNKIILDNVDCNLAAPGQELVQ